MISPPYLRALFPLHLNFLYLFFYLFFSPQVYASFGGSSKDGLTDIKARIAEQMAAASEAAKHTQANADPSATSPEQSKPDEATKASQSAAFASATAAPSVAAGSAPAELD